VDGKQVSDLASHNDVGFVCMAVGVDERLGVHTRLIGAAIKRASGKEKALLRGLFHRGAEI
jgi:hypothetical protein